jgi:hypothetical protein
MSKVYLHDEATGTSVAPSRRGGVHVQAPVTSHIDDTADGGLIHFTGPMFRAVIEGGLRWMLENEGDDAVYDFANKVTRAWLKGNGR